MLCFLFEGLYETEDVMPKKEGLLRQKNKYSEQMF